MNKNEYIKQHPEQFRWAIEDNEGNIVEYFESFSSAFNYLKAKELEETCEIILREEYKMEKINKKIALLNMVKEVYEYVNDIIAYKTTEHQELPFPEVLEENYNNEIEALEEIKNKLKELV